MKSGDYLHLILHVAWSYDEVVSFIFLFLHIPCPCILNVCSSTDKEILNEEKYISARACIYKNQRTWPTSSVAFYRKYKEIALRQFWEHFCHFDHIMIELFPLDQWKIFWTSFHTISHLWLNTSFVDVVAILHLFLLIRGLFEQNNLFFVYHSWSLSRSEKIIWKRIVLIARLLLYVWRKFWTSFCYSSLIRPFPLIVK